VKTLEQLSSLLFNRSDAVVDLALSFVRGCGLGANQCVGTATALGHVGAVTVVAADDLVQVLAAMFGKRKACLAFVWISEERGELTAIAAIALDFVVPSNYSIFADTQGLTSFGLSPGGRLK